ncbi:hypothetical protein IIC65_05455 [Candidatus Sumerlaeota bacterium]|nr:hypothetical protein [Candidatus Sumerlaeota bacterium]
MTQDPVQEAPREREIQWRCPACLGANREKPSAPGTGPWTCRTCGETQPDRPDSISPEGAMRACPVCGCPDLYRQRDFNRKLGVAIVIVGAALAPFTRFISLAACALIDFALYLLVAQIAVCYHCRSIFRGYPEIGKTQPFDLNTSDKYIEIERRRGW